MSFVWKADKPLLSEEQIARQVHGVSVGRGLDDLASVLALMCIRQESAFWCPWNAKDPSSRKYPHDSESDDGRSVGYYQQQNGKSGEELPPGDRDNWWGPMSSRMDLRKSTDVFLSRLPDSYVHATNAAAAGAVIQGVQGSAFPLAYAPHWTYCWSLLNRALASTPTPLPPGPPAVKPVNIQPNPGWRGDPLFLPQLLEAFSVNVTTYTDAAGIPWDQRGHGDFGRITYVVWHHTGSVNETDRGIAHHPKLGLAANMLIHEDGHVVLTGSGIAWHAGEGVWPGVPEDSMNQISIGVECAYSWGPGVPVDNPWPAVQVEAMIRVGGAISWFLGNTLPPDHQIAHKEWAGRDNPLGINKQGKPDPANFDMNWFRRQIGLRAAAGPTGVTGGEDMATVPQEQWDRVYRELTQRLPSRSIYREPNEGTVDTMAGMLLNVDAMNHQELVERLALLYRDADAIKRISRVAAGRGADPDNVEAIEHARAVLKQLKAQDATTEKAGA